ncbi:hypothetical protein VNI00_003628 [Paramarasmius palmivorus]|uniref:Uncharacterized protein n=1 Tax=Paramarasmius palmivorus TaxID=297713 RepID=A0AAW0DS78_9AGAR
MSLTEHLFLVPRFSAYGLDPRWWRIDDQGFDWDGIPPEKLQKPFIVSSILFGATLIGLLAWAVSTVGGGGPMWNQPGKPSHGSIGWSMMFGITSVLGACRADFITNVLCVSEILTFGGIELVTDLNSAP